MMISSGVTTFEELYYNLAVEIVAIGEHRLTRNAPTLALFGRSVTADLRDGFPMLQGRKLFPRGVFGELAAMLRYPDHVSDFTMWGCNYWDSWGDEDDNLTLDYGNAWRDQIPEFKRLLRDDPASRRIMINGWRPERIPELSLPCCHYSYQFYVDNHKGLHMVWTQRSVDVMVGLPSDMIFAAAWLIAIANEFNYEPRTIKMDFGDTHIYEDHLPLVTKYFEQYDDVQYSRVEYAYDMPKGSDFCLFDPNKLTLHGYTPQPKIGFKLHA